MHCPICRSPRTERRSPEQEVLAFYQPYEDADGRPHHHNPNVRDIVFRCSGGHTFRVVRARGCPVDDCSWEEQQHVSVLHDGAWRPIEQLGDLHYHSCPECYEIRQCDYRCVFEPDLEDKGRQFGSHEPCPGCRPAYDARTIREHEAFLSRLRRERVMQRLGWGSRVPF